MQTGTVILLECDQSYKVRMLGEVERIQIDSVNGIVEVYCDFYAEFVDIAEKDPNALISLDGRHYILLNISSFRKVLNHEFC